MCLDALLPRRTPWCPFNQVHSRGSNPSELYLAKIVTVSRCDIPSCDWQPCRVQQTKSLLRSRLPETGHPPGLTPRPGHEVRSLSDPWRLPRFRRMWHCCHCGLASGVSSLCRLGSLPADFSAPDSALALLGFASLGRSPSLPSSLAGSSRCLVGAREKAPRTAPEPHGTRPR
jgi:hypothetical protein